MPIARQLKVPMGLPMAHRLGARGVVLVLGLLAALAACDGGDGTAGTLATSTLSGGGDGGLGGANAGGANAGGANFGGNIGGAGGDGLALDECAEGLAICAADADCIDTPGYYECACKPGYAGDGKICDDVNECSNLLHDCAPTAVCTNTAGSFSCGCAPGFSGDGKTCMPTYESVAAGRFHACAIRTDKSLWCWGLNTSSQIGIGTSDLWLQRPVSPSDAKNWKSVAAIEVSTCALNTDGFIFCWGNNSYYQLGNGTVTSASSPTAAAGGTGDWLTLDGGRLHVCGIKASGEAYCWGYNGNNQLGDGAPGNGNKSYGLPVAGGKQWLKLAAGNDHTCGIASDNTLWCWGLNSTYQLGDGTTVLRAVPTQEKTLASDWLSVDVAATSTCAVKLNGQRWCWGTNYSGAGGDGYAAGITAPKWVDLEVDWATVYGHASTDGNFCGRRTDGRLFCWGDGTMGQTGQPGAEAVTLNPLQVGVASDWISVANSGRFACGVRATGELFCWGATSRGGTGSGFVSDRLDPTFVGTDTDWDAVDTHVEFSCGLRASKLYCWGRNVNGMLADGTVISHALPAAADPAESYARLSLGRYFGCGVTGGAASGSVRCWGSDAQGQLGNGTGAAVDALVPASVPATPGNASPWTEVAAGEYGVCGIKADKTLWCWGYDAQGQVGNGSGTSATQQSPVALLANEPADWLAVSQAANTVCALRGGGTLWCWGHNNLGQVGNGSTANVTAPELIGNATQPPLYTQLSVGRGHACAVAAGGTLWCWGGNGSGELGLGYSGGTVTAPMQVGTDTDWQSAHVGSGNHSCARKLDDHAYCWGSNFIGQIGLGTYGNTNKPQKLASPITWNSLAPGHEGSCGLRLDGRLLCWGTSLNAQLGSGIPFLSTPTPVEPPQ